MASEGTARSPNSDRIGKYEIVSKIGQGAMGEVYKARDTVLDRFVAIKTMSAAVLGNPEMGQRFLREAQSAARLNHPNVVTLHEFGEDAGRFFMAMELLDGEDLSHTLKRGALPTLEDKLPVMEQILDGVAYAHNAGVIHRDLKPANIHIQKNGHIKVMDFGLARLGESEITRAGTVMGTPNYMSPEQVRGREDRAGFGRLRPRRHVLRDPLGSARLRRRLHARGPLQGHRVATGAARRDLRGHPSDHRDLHLARARQASRTPLQRRRSDAGSPRTVPAGPRRLPR